MILKLLNNLKEVLNVELKLKNQKKVMDFLVSEYTYGNNDFFVQLKIFNKKS